MRKPAPLAPTHRPRPGNGRLRLRRMVPADLDEVMAIEKEAFVNPWSAELFRRELTHDWSTILIAEGKKKAAAGSILGFVIYWLVHNEIHVLNVAVHKDQRRKGVARSLLAECLERGRQAGATLATLEVRRTNQAAIDLYGSLGFRAVGVRPNYYADEGEDAIVMVLDLG